MCLEQQLLPQQRVIICCGEENDLGETVGHYGIVVQVLAEAKLRFPSQHQLWSYRVFIPLLDRQIVVPARQLVSTGILDDLKEDLD